MPLPVFNHTDSVAFSAVLLLHALAVAALLLVYTPEVDLPVRGAGLVTARLIDATVKGVQSPPPAASRPMGKTTVPPVAAHVAASATHRAAPSRKTHKPPAIIVSRAPQSVTRAEPTPTAPAAPAVVAPALASLSPASTATATTVSQPPATIAPLSVSQAADQADASTTSSTRASERGSAATRHAYFAAVLARLNRYKHYPAALRKEKIEGRVVVTFTIEADGRVVGAVVKNSSGYSALDQAAREMLARASPLPAIPDDMERQHLTMSVPVEYSLLTER